MKNVNHVERKLVISIPTVEAILKEKVLSNLNYQKKDTKNKDLRFSYVDGEQIYTMSDRYKTFFTKGYTCPVCGLKGQYFALERTGDPSNVNNRYHLNLYGLDKDGNEVLITKDHIIPKSKGGKNSLENYQPMCEYCNSKKGNGD